MRGGGTLEVAKLSRISKVLVWDQQVRAEREFFVWPWGRFGLWENG